MSSSENNQLSYDNWAAWENGEGKKWDEEILSCNPAFVWAGMTSECVHCGQLVEVIDSAKDLFSSRTGLTGLKWRHWDQYYACHDRDTVATPRIPPFRIAGGQK